MKKIFLTGVSGCIGHYIAEILLENPDYELYFLVRNIAVLIATSWGGEEESYQINVVKTLELISYLDAQICEKVLYFSTASILNQNNQPLPEAGEIGTNYIRTKYICYSKFTDLEIADKIITLYPTFVLGGDENKPYSHIYGGLPDVLKYIGLVRWFQADGSFHFIHAKDIAQVVNYLIENPAPESFAMNYRHFTHIKTYTPDDFGLKNYCSTLDDVLTLRGIPRKKP